MVANANAKKKTWKLTPEQLRQRREMLGRELDEVAKRRDDLRSATVRLAEVKELIKATPEGEEQEELKASIKDVETILEGLHKNVERLSREVLTEETEEPQDGLPGVDTSKPSKPKAPKPSAAARTLALPEVAGPGLTDEAQPHEGGPIAPPAPPAPRALPAHPDAIEAEIVSESPTAKDAVLAALAAGPTTSAALVEQLARPAPTVRGALSKLASDGRVVYDDGLWSLA